MLTPNQQIHRRVQSYEDVKPGQLYKFAPLALMQKYAYDTRFGAYENRRYMQDGDYWLVISTDKHYIETLHLNTGFLCGITFENLWTLWALVQDPE